MNTTDSNFFGLPSSFYQNIPLEAKEVESDVKSTVGLLVLSLAKNFLGNDAAIEFTIKQINTYKKSGISLSAPLKSDQIHRVVSELGILSMSSIVSQEAPLLKEKNELDSQVLDFGGMSDEELLKVEKDLQSKLDRIENQKQLEQLIEKFRSSFIDLEGRELVIDYEVLEKKFTDKLQESINSKPSTLSQIGKAEMEKVANNIQGFQDLYARCNEFVKKLTNDHHFSPPENYVEETVRAYLLSQSKAVADAILSDNSKSGFTKIFAGLSFGTFASHLIDQIKNSKNLASWNRLPEEIRQEAFLVARNKYSMENLAAKEKQQIENVIQRVTSNPQNVDWSGSSENFESSISSLKEKLRFEFDDLLQSIKWHRDRQETIKELTEEYMAFLEEKSQKTHKIALPAIAKEIIRDSISDIALVEAKTYSDPLAFADRMQICKEHFFDSDQVGKWLKLVSDIKKRDQFIQIPKNSLNSFGKKALKKRSPQIVGI